MWTFITQEWKYWLKAPMTWVFLLINTLLITGAVASDNIVIGDSTGSIHKNAPFVIQNYYGVMSLICLLMTTAYMNATANRDFAHGMYQFIFSSPIKKSHYFFGKFIGAATIAVIPLLGISIGSLIGPLIPNLDPERYGEIIWSGHINGLLVFGIPNTLIASVLLFGLAIVFRSNIVSFVGAMLILVFYIISSGYTADMEKEWLSNLLDPFGFNPLGYMSKYMTVDEKNTLSIPLAGAVLWNRLIWLGISAGLLFLFYMKFSFSEKKQSSKKQRIADNTENSVLQEKTPVLQKPQTEFSWASWLRMVRFESKSIISNPTFLIILLLGIINLIVSLTSFTDGYGLSQYPVTYNVISSIKGGFYTYLIAIITFYTGVLVWRERDCRIHEIQDASPVKSIMLLSSKFIALVSTVAIILTMTMFIGISAQILHGYFRFELSLYLTELLVFDLLAFSFIMVIALLFHYLINNRYIAYFAFITFIILNNFIWEMLQMNSNLLIYSGIPDMTYSDMNGFGPFIPSVTWFYLYWSINSLLLFFLLRAFFVRGKENSFKLRLRKAIGFLSEKKGSLTIILSLLLCCGAYIYYNTMVLNEFESELESEQKQVDYEKSYKKYEKLIQPRYLKFDYHIDIYPEERALKAGIKSLVKNISDQTIADIHFTLPMIYDSITIFIPGAKLKLEDKKLNYRIYSLTKPLRPGDSLGIDFSFIKQPKGFENEVTFLQLTHNGTFFNNTDIVPQFGYVSAYELSDRNKRKKYGLPLKNRMPKLNENDRLTRSNSYISNCSDWVEVSSIVSTSKDQIAIAPGSLRRQWSEGDRNYFEYKLDQKALDFYSFLSGRYEVARKKWQDINLEVYYIKEHAYNVPNMLKSMEKSLEYYTTNFGKYYHKQCRIIEFPRYASFAQAFPGTMPYSEGIGFIADLSNTNKDDIDLVFYVVAHEMGHQYWAHQFCGAQMQGSEWMSEGFAQYSALMVMEKEYGKDRMKRFLKYEMDEYLSNRGRETEAEQPIYKTESQPYIHYQKSSVAMYYLKEMIGQDRLNQALKSLIDTFGYQKPPYATSLQALRAIRKVTPDSLQYVVTDLFEKITLFSNRVIEAKSKKVGDSYEITLICQSEKFLADSLGNEREIIVDDFIDVGCFGKPAGEDKIGKRIFYERRKINRKNNTIVFRKKEEPFMAGIDPLNYLIDRVPDDNLKRIEQN